MAIGEKLNETREAKHLSLDDIQEMTKIQKRYLVAIEQEDFHTLPGRFYARAFIKEYAQAVGLDHIELLQDFDESNIQVDQEENFQYTRMEKSRRARTPRSSSIFSLFPTIIVIILVIGIIFIAWALYQKTLSNSDTEIEDRQENDQIIRNVDESKQQDDEQDSGSNEEESDDESEETEEQSDNEAHFSVVEVGTGSAPLSEMDFNSADHDVEITFDVSERTYIEIKGASDTTYFSGELDANMENEPIDISSEERIYFNIGNTSGLTIKFNGIDLDYPVDPTEKVHQKLWINLNKND